MKEKRREQGPKRNGVLIEAVIKGLKTRTIFHFLSISHSRTNLQDSLPWASLRPGRPIDGQRVARRLVNP